MEFYQAILLAVVQGLTEFLPVSSSGHLVIVQHLFGIALPELLFDVSVHVGTLGAVCLVFRSDIRHIAAALLRLPALVRSAGGPIRLMDRNPAVRMAVLVVAGSVPTAILGLGFHRAADRLFGSVTTVGFMLLVTGTLLWITRWVDKAPRTPVPLGIRQALVIGLVQGIAILPGISRSGSTISVALLLGVDRDLAGRFSFLLSIPAIVGALMLSLASAEVSSASPAVVLGAVAVSALVGVVALKILLGLVHRGRLHRFAPYCWLLGVAALVLHWVAVI